MRAIASILSATLAGSVLLQGYFAIWRPSSFGRFAEFPAIVLYAALIVAGVFLLLVIPCFVWLRRKQRRLAWPVGALLGMLLGCAISSFSFRDSVPYDFPICFAELVAGGMSGAVGVGLYARLSFKSVA